MREREGRTSLGGASSQHRRRAHGAMRSARALELIQLLALAAAPRACVGRISSPPPEPPAPPPQRTARLSGNLVSERAVVAEAVASVAHHLTITLENEEFATSLAAADVVAALARAGDGDDDAGWDAAVAAAEVRWERADNRTLRVTVPQLRAFHVSHDLTVRVALPPGLLASSAPRAILAASGADGARRRARAAIQRAAASQTGASSVELGNEPPLEALPYLTIKSRYARRAALAPRCAAPRAPCHRCVGLRRVGRVGAGDRPVPRHATTLARGGGAALSTYTRIPPHSARPPRYGTPRYGTQLPVRRRFGRAVRRLRRVQRGGPQSLARVRVVRIGSEASAAAQRRAARGPRLRGSRLLARRAPAPPPRVVRSARAAARAPHPRALAPARAHSHPALVWQPLVAFCALCGSCLLYTSPSPRD